MGLVFTLISSSSSRGAGLTEGSCWFSRLLSPNTLSGGDCLMVLLFDFADFRLNNLLHIFALISLASAKFPNGTRYRFVNCELVAMQTIKDFSS